MKKFLAFLLVFIAMGNISCYVSTQAEMQVSSGPAQAEAMAEVQAQKSENFEGIYRTAYDYLLEHPVKNKPKGYISAIVLKRSTNQFTGQGIYEIRFLALNEEGEYRIICSGFSPNATDLDALLDLGDYVIANKNSCSWDSYCKIIKKEAVKIPRQESPIPLFIPKKEEEKN